MTIGAALLLIAAGAILRFAVATISTHGIDIHIIGDILMGVGALGLILWLAVLAPWARRRRSRPPQLPPYGDEPPEYGQYRQRGDYRPDDPDAYRYRSGETEPYPREGSYQDPYRR